MAARDPVRPADADRELSLAHAVAAQALRGLLETLRNRQTGM
jgi:hypothetical protein